MEADRDAFILPLQLKRNNDQLHAQKEGYIFFSSSQEKSIANGWKRKRARAREGGKVKIENLG